ncbi:Nucleobindin-2 [Lamellibrachia satsuma]|nr:Nucleobindin-2 [Lamellibrachia satsuma]
MDKKDFDPKTFFYLHDVNGDGFLDENEVESLFQKELDKLYDPNAPEDDQMERYEEMNRMREHVMKEIDKNDDRMVSLDEFVESTKRASYEKEEGWEDLEDNEQFSDEEFEKFQKEYHEKHGMPEEVHNEVPHQEVHQQQQQHQEQQPPVQQGHQQGPGQQPGQHIQPPQGQPIRQPEQHQQQPPS